MGNNGKFFNVAGQRFGRWTAKKHLGGVRWECICDCGTVKNISSYTLRHGISRSCGCLVPLLVSARRRDPRGPAGRVYDQYRRNCKKVGREMNISFDRFTELIQQNCHYCDSIPIGGSMDRAFRYNGLDRVDNRKGYTEDNIVVACTLCNRMKDSISYDRFLRGVKAIYEFRKLNVQENS